MARLEIQNLNKTYSSQVVPVKDLSLTAEDDTFLTLLGPSGCGKSTILRAIAGLERPTRGKIKIGDRDVTNLKPGDRNIAMVFQSYALYPHMSVRENIAAGLRIRKLPKQEIRSRVQDVSEKLGLGNLLDRRPSELSGGQRQRVALARALVRRPDVFLLDEPLSNLDALLREQVRADLKQVFASQSAPVVYVTHDQTEAMTLSTQVAVLHEGRVQQLDSPDRIYQYPANEFVAGFIGSPQMNLSIVKCEGDRAILGNARLPVPPEMGDRALAVLGVRPENVRLAEPEDEGAIVGHVFLVENLGASKLASVRVPDDNGNPITLRCLIPSDRAWSGNEVRLTISPNALHWFDAQTRDRIDRPPARA